MSRSKRLLALVAVWVASASLWGCAPAKQTTPTAIAAPMPAAPAKPQWVNMGSIVVKGDVEERVVYGVGLASGISDPALQREVADAAARAELSKVFQTWVAAMLKSYKESITKDGATTEAMRFESVLREFTKEKLIGARIVDHWEDPQKNVLYALAKMVVDARALDAKMKEMGLTQTQASQVMESADRAFGNLDSGPGGAP